METRLASKLTTTLGSHSTPQNTKYIAEAARKNNGVVVARYQKDAEVIQNVYGVEAVSLENIRSAVGRLLFWDSTAIWGLARVCELS